MTIILKFWLAFVVINESLNVSKRVFSCLVTKGNQADYIVSTIKSYTEYRFAVVAIKPIFVIPKKIYKSSIGIGLFNRDLKTLYEAKVYSGPYSIQPRCKEYQNIISIEFRFPFDGIYLKFERVVYKKRSNGDCEVNLKNMLLHPSSTHLDIRINCLLDEDEEKYRILKFLLEETSLSN